VLRHVAPVDVADAALDLELDRADPGQIDLTPRSGLIFSPSALSDWASCWRRAWRASFEGPVSLVLQAKARRIRDMQMR
jgi:hypothetical protein